MAVAVLGMSATMNFAKAQCVNEYGNKEPFAVEFSRLSSYLGLAPYQMEEVLNINDYFVQEQRKSLSKDLKRQDERLQKAVRHLAPATVSCAKNQYFHRFLFIVTDAKIINAGL